MEELEKVKALVIFSEEGTLSKTAEKMNISQPSLTRSMAELEDKIGVPLFDRTRNSIALNETGRYVVEKFRNLLISVENMREDIVNYNSINKELIVESQQTYLPEIHEFLGKIDQVFSKKYIYNQKTSPEIIDDLKQGIVDVAFLTEPVKVDGYKCEIFLYDNLSVCVPPDHPLAQKPVLYIRDLQNYSFISEKILSYWQEIVSRELDNPFFVKVENMQELEVLMRDSSIPSIGTQKCCARCEYRAYRKTLLIHDDISRIIIYIIYKPGNVNLENIIKGIDN